jgi:hypothetical protein
MKEFKAEQGYGTENTRAKSCNTSGRAGAGLDAKGWRELGVNLLSTAALICGVAALFSPAGAAVGVAALVFGFASAGLRCFDSNAADCRGALLSEAVTPFAGVIGRRFAGTIGLGRRGGDIAESVTEASLSAYSAQTTSRDWSCFATRW